MDIDELRSAVKFAALRKQQSKGPVDPEGMLNVKAAYGRQYTTASEAMADWLQGKDFKIIAGPYCSIRDLSAIRYKYPRGVRIWFDTWQQSFPVGSW